MTDNYLIKNIEEHIDVIESAKNLGSMITKAIVKITNCLSHDGRMLIMGNGGSFADAIHIEGELVGKFMLNRRPFCVKAIGTSGSFLTAWSNDILYETAYAREVEAYMGSGDILWGISTSGNSENIIRAFEKGRELKTYNFFMSGRTGGKIKEKNLTDLEILVDSENTPRIQEAHELIYHIICGEIEKGLVNGRYNK